MQQQQQQLAQFKRNLLIVPFFFFVNVVDFPEKKSNFISSNEGLLQLIKTSRPLDESQKKKKKKKNRSINRCSRKLLSIQAGNGSSIFLDFKKSQVLSETISAD